MPKTLMTLDQVLERSRSMVEETGLERIESWKRAHPGGRAIGCFPVYVPAEIVHAAGMLPFGLFGGGAKVEITHADARFQSFVCSISKSTLELALRGQLAPLDGAVLSSICDVARNLASVLARNFPELHVVYLHLPQNVESRAVVDYLEAELRRLAEGFREKLSAPVEDGALGDSILLYNRWRARLRELYALRARSPEKISTGELYCLVRAGTRLTPEEHLPMLEEALRAIPARSASARDRVKVVVEGAFCEQPPLGLLEILEEAGCYIVEDDLLVGWRWFFEDVPLTDNPWRSLAESYLTRSVSSSVRHDGSRPRTEALVEKVRRSGAEAVIFLPAKFCEPALFDYVLYRTALEKARIPHLLLEFEEKMSTYERTRNEVETFVESMLFE